MAQKLSEFHSTHDLEFLVANRSPFLEWCRYNGWGSATPIMKHAAEFKVGTCRGVFTADKENYYIFVIENEEKGNGHFQDVLDWFYQSCIRDRHGLVFLLLLNNRFEKHLRSMGYADWFGYGTPGLYLPCSRIKKTAHIYDT